MAQIAAPLIVFSKLAFQIGTCIGDVVRRKVHGARNNSNFLMDKLIMVTLLAPSGALIAIPTY